MNHVDLSELAMNRQPAVTSGFRSDGRQFLSRYILPGLIIAGFTAILIRASWDRIFPPRPVSVVPVIAMRTTLRSGGMPSFRAAGWVEPRPALIRVPSLTSGVIRDVLVVEGDRVTAGQPIALLVRENAELTWQRAQAETRNRMAELERSEAQLKAARMRLMEPLHLQGILAEAEGALAQVSSRIERLPFELRRAESQRDFAKQDLEGKQGAAGAVTGRAILSAQAALESAIALVEELDSQKSSLEQEFVALQKRCHTLNRQLELLVDETLAVESAQSNVKIAEALCEQAKADEALAALRLERSTVRAPADGRIHRILHAVGATLAGREQTGEPAGDAVATIYQPGSLQIRADVRFENIRQVSAGQPTEIRCPAVDEVVRGTVITLGSEADIQKNTLQVRIAIHDPPDTFRPEMLVDVTFIEPEELTETSTQLTEHRLFVPGQLIFSNEGHSFVWLADQSGGVAAMRAVECGEQSPDGLTEILSGLSLTERLIAGETQGLRDGTRIRVTGELSDPGTGRLTSLSKTQSQPDSLQPSHRKGN